MKKIRQINNWIIKEKRLDESPNFIEDDRKYCVFSPTRIFQEDNLTLDEAIEFCKENLDYIKTNKSNILKMGQKLES